MNEQKRNVEIDFLRLLLCLDIVMYHICGWYRPEVTYPPFAGGYIAVEAFFIISGYFAAKKVAANPNAGCQTAFFWTVKKYLGILIYVVPVCIIHRVLDAVFQNMSLGDAAKSFMYAPYEMLLIQAAGIRYDSVVDSALWYVSTLVIVLPLFYVVLLKANDFITYIGAPLGAFLFYGDMCLTYGTVNHWMPLFSRGVTVGLLRAWAGLGLGAAAFKAAQKIHDFPPMSKGGKSCITVVEVVSLAAAEGILFFRAGKLDFLCIILWLAVISIAASERSSLSAMLPAWLSRISELYLVVYVCHTTILDVLNTTAASVPYFERIGLYLALILLYALLLQGAVRSIKKMKLAEKIKERFFT